jgi:hypothetical protein
MTQTIKVIDKTTLRKSIRPALDAKLKELSEELGIEITTANASFDPSGMNGDFKLKLAILSENGVVETPERTAYKQYHAMYGLPENGLDQTVVISNRRFRVAGIRTRAPKNNILLEALDGKSDAVARQSVVKDALEKAEVLAV